jgi:hypothetical protein
MNNYLQGGRNNVGNNKLQQAQTKVEEVRLVMEDNVRKMIDN